MMKFEPRTSRRSVTTSTVFNYLSSIFITYLTRHQRNRF